MATFLLSGLWHGANWTYILWGGIHGLCQIVGSETAGFRSSLWDKLHIKTQCWSWEFGKAAGTFALTTLAWIFFRCESIGQAFAFIRRLFTKFDFWTLFDGTIYQLGLGKKEWSILLFSVRLLLIVDALQYKTGKKLNVLLAEQNMFFRWFVVIAAVVFIFWYGEYGPSVTAAQFIYFQF